MFLRKITIIGAGSVGSASAYSLAIQNIAGEIVLVDINYDKAAGEALDIYQGTPLMDSPVNIYAGSYEDAAGSEIVVITSGLPRKPDQTRLDLAQTNIDILKEIAPRIVAVCPDATYLFVSNPVDILTYAFGEITGLPENQILGTGTLLDTARLRAFLAHTYSVSQRSVHAYVFGEHGDSSFVPWSICQIATINPLEGKKRFLTEEKVTELDCEEVERHIRTSGAEIIRRKGCTNYAIATAVSVVCESLYNPANSILTVSTRLTGEYDISDVCLSLPTLVGNGRVRGHMIPRLNDEEYRMLAKSSETIKSILRGLKF